MLSESPLRILVSDGNQLFCDLIGEYFGKQKLFEITIAESLEQTLQIIDEAGPFDVVLINVELPDLKGIEGVRACVMKNAPKYVAILAGIPINGMLQELVDIGVMGVLSTRITARSLQNALQLIATGDPYISLTLMHEDEAGTSVARAALSPREMTVLRYLGEGWPNREISNELGLSESTVKMHVQSICRKLGARNRTQAVLNAHDSGML